MKLIKPVTIGVIALLPSLAYTAELTPSNSPVIHLPSGIDIPKQPKQLKPHDYAPTVLQGKPGGPYYPTPDPDHGGGSGNAPDGVDVPKPKGPDPIKN